jgi:PcfJ-like protein
MTRRTEPPESRYLVLGLWALLHDRLNIEGGLDIPEDRIFCVAGSRESRIRNWIDHILVPHVSNNTEYSLPVDFTCFPTVFTTGEDEDTPLQIHYTAKFSFVDSRVTVIQQMANTVRELAVVGQAVEEYRKGSHLSERFRILRQAFPVVVIEWINSGARIPLDPTRLPFSEAERLAQAWHTNLQSERTSRKLKTLVRGNRTRLGEMTYRNFHDGTIDAYEFELIDDEFELAREGAAMHHCVGGYAIQLISNRSAFVHARCVRRTQRYDPLVTGPDNQLQWTIELEAIPQTFTVVEPLGQKLNGDTMSHHTVTKKLNGIRISQCWGIQNRAPSNDLMDFFRSMFDTELLKAGPVGNRMATFQLSVLPRFQKLRSPLTTSFYADSVLREMIGLSPGEFFVTGGRRNGRNTLNELYAQQVDLQRMILNPLKDNDEILPDTGSVPVVPRSERDGELRENPGTEPSGS